MKILRITFLSTLCILTWGLVVGTSCYGANMTIYVAESGKTQPLSEGYGVFPGAMETMDLRVKFDTEPLLLWEENGYGPLFQFSISSSEITPLWEASWVSALPQETIFGTYLSADAYGSVFSASTAEGGLYLNAAEWTPQNAEGWDGRIAPGDYLLGRIQVQLDASAEIGTAWNFKILYGVASYDVIDAIGGESLNFAITPGDGGEATLSTLVASETPGPIAPAVPEPSTWAVLMGMGLVGGLIFRRRLVTLR